jgi:hypothetical protein
MRDNCCTPGLALSGDSQSAAAMPICGEAFCSEAPDYFAGSRINHISLRIIEDFLRRRQRPPSWVAARQWLKRGDPRSLARALKFRNQSGMALTPDQEREWIAQLEGMGVTLVRSELERGKISPHRVHLTATWLSAKDKEAEAGREASKSEQIELARRASEAADRAATAAELQAIEARRANKRATIALVIAIISIIGTAVSIWLTHIDAHK